VPKSLKRMKLVVAQHVLYVEQPISVVLYGRYPNSLPRGGWVASIRGLCSDSRVAVITPTGFYAASQEGGAR